MQPDPHAPVEARFDVEVSGKQMEVGDALRTRITEEVTAGVGRYFDRGGEADVHVRRDGHGFCVDIVVRLASGQRLVASSTGGDAHAAFDGALTKLETRVRRYKRRLVNHHDHSGERGETALYTVLKATDEDDDLATDEWGADGSAGNGAPAAAIVAETQSEIRTTTVSMAVMELDLTEAPVVLFRNLAHGGLSVVYRRADGNIGWLDPERGRAVAAAG